MAKHSGRLELTWTDKDKALLSTGDGRYDYTFVDPSDYRVSEVRLLHEVSGHDQKVPDNFESSASPTTDNLLITGDAMHALDALRSIPEYADRYLGKIRLCYIDPPFNTGQAFTSYEDNIEHSIWLTLLRDRLNQIKPLLSDDGSVWVHLDDAEVHRCRAVLDEVLGMENFVGTVIWQKAYSPRNDAPAFSTDQDYILVYSNRPGWRSNRFDRLASRDALYTSADGDARQWVSGDPAAPSAHRNQTWVYAIQSPFNGNLVYPARGRCWGQNQDSMQSLVEEWGVRYRRQVLDDDDRRALICGVPVAELRKNIPALIVDMEADEAAAIVKKRYEKGSWPRLYFTRKGAGGLKLKRYLDEISTSRAPQTLWMHSEVGHSRSAKAELKTLFPEAVQFSTPKPERLMQRIIQIATDPGDIVLDCFAGSGTTAAVAHKMGRRWVTSELSPENVKTYTKPRLLKVINGEDRGGVSTVTDRVAADDVEYPDGVTADQAQTFTTLVKKFGDELNLFVDVAKQTAKAVRAQAKDGSSVLDEDETRTLIRLLNKVSRSEDEGLIVDLMPEAVKTLRAAARTRDEATVNWAGGGGFTHLELGESMFEELQGRVFLADWATNGALTKAMCAQLGLRHRSDGIFAAKSGKVRYVILDGMVTSSTVDAILDQLADDEIVEVWATQIDVDAAERLQKLRQGSRLRSIPDSVLDSYRRKGAKRSPFQPEKPEPNGEQN